jgi:hypothetical protein
MTKTVAEKLSDLVQAVRQLPDETQEALVEEFAGRLSDFTDSSLSDEQRAEVDRRLANPRYADPDKVREFFARFGAQSE